MARREPGSIQSVLRSTSRGLIALALVAAPVAARAAQLSQVRVGTHEDHTRIVLELDAATSYRLSPPGAAGSQLQIQLDAESIARHVTSKSPLVKSVSVEPSQRGSTISVSLSKPGVEVSEMVLTDPPRIVLDLKPAGSMAAMMAPSVPAPKAAPAPAAAAPPPAPAPAAAAAPATAPKAAAAAPAAPTTPAASEGRLSADGKPVSALAPEGAPSLSDPVPNDIVAKPAARFDAPEVKSAASSAATATPPAAKPGAPAPSVNPEIVAKAAEEPAAPADASASAEPKPIAAAPMPAAAPAARPAEVVVRKAAPPAEAKAAGRSWSDWLTSPTGYAAIGGVLLAVVVLAVRRRRRDEDDDPLYSVMSADDAGADDEDLRGQQEDPVVEWGRREVAEDEQPAYAATSFDADEPVSRDGSQQLALGRLRPQPEELAPAADPDPDSLFDGPGAPAIATPVAPAISVPSDTSYGGDATRIAGELESRVKDMERRLEQLAEARERLERQVAAQTEELRVQRAAIARTQRVVRSMSKGEELATEPVPRAPQA